MALKTPAAKQMNASHNKEQYSKTFVLFDPLRPINNISVKKGRVFLS